MFNIFRQNKARTLVVKHGKSPCVCTCTFKANTPLPMLTQQQQQLLLLWPRDHWKQTWGKKKSEWEKRAAREVYTDETEVLFLLTFQKKKKKRPLSFTAAPLQKKTATLPTCETATSCTPDAKVRFPYLLWDRIANRHVHRGIDDQRFTIKLSPHLARSRSAPPSQ